MEIDFSVFDCLLKAPSKDYISRLLLESFRNRDNVKISTAVLRSISEQLDIELDASEKLIKQLVNLIKKVLFESLDDLPNVQNVFAGSSLPTNLVNLISKLLVEKLPNFKKQVANSQNMVPKLVDYDWRVDIKTDSNLSGSDDTSKSGQQTCILQLKNEPTRLTTTKPVKRQPSQSKPNDINEILRQQFRSRSEKQLGLMSFFSRIYPNDKCGSNGLPLTPNSIRIYGRFQLLKSLSHKSLCQYIDIQRSTNSPDRLFIITEHYSLNLNDLLNDAYLHNLLMISNTGNILTKWFYQIVQAFNYLSKKKIVHRYLELCHICIDPSSNAKLNNYGLFHMAEGGFCVDFPIVNIPSIPPECLILEYIHANKFSKCPANNTEQNFQLFDQKADVWSFGVCLFQFFFGLSNKSFNHLIKPQRVIQYTFNFLSNELKTGYDFLLGLYEIDKGRQHLYETRIQPFFLKLIKKCLVINSRERPTFKDLLSVYEDHLITQKDYKYLLTPDIDENNWNVYGNALRCETLQMKTANDEFELMNVMKEDHLWKRDVEEVYYLWKLAGGDCQAALAKSGRLKKILMPCQKLGCYVRVDDGQEFGKNFDNEMVFDNEIIPLSLEQLRKRLSSLNSDCFYPISTDLNVSEEGRERRLTTASLGTEMKRRYYQTFMSLDNEPNEADFIKSMQTQPHNIRESDIEYQFHRIVIFSRYLRALPFKKHALFKECIIDIPPLYRGLAWAALLDCQPGEALLAYQKINKEIVTQTDRQIDVDVPRCHQYDPLMASPQAHYKLKRVLKAWVLSQPHLVYWQGLDSLCAPFLYLNFNNEALAYGCLKNFVNKYAANFFLKDNSAVIHEYLTVFSHLIAFNDAELADHFEEIEFRPDLYAIPWFLTMFAHVFPLYKIFHLWDTLLLGSSEFPLCIGAAILHQLRKILLNSDFNECILLFSELPEINITKCVMDAVEIFSVTPASCLYRAHAKSQVIPISYDSEDEDNIDLVEDPNLDIISTSLNELRDQFCPRISTRDVLRLYEKDSSKLLLIDLRLQIDYSQFHVLNSINIPFDNLTFERLNQLSEQSINQLVEADLNNSLMFNLQKKPNALKVIYSSQETFNQAVELANFLVQETEDYVNETPKVEFINLELSKQTLTTMLDGLSKIKDQLNSVAVAQ